MTICLGQGLYFKIIIFAGNLQIICGLGWAVGCRFFADILRMEFWFAEKVQTFLMIAENSVV